MDSDRKIAWLVWLSILMIAGCVFLYVRAGSIRSALDAVHLGQEREAQGDMKSAMQSYQQAVRLRPNSGYTLIVLGDAYLKTGDAEQALSSYKRALLHSPRNFWAHYSIGRLYESQGRYVDAIEKFGELTALEDDWLQSNKMLHYDRYRRAAYRELGLCYAKTGDKAKSIANYRRYLQLEPAADDRQAVQHLIDGK